MKKLAFLIGLLISTSALAQHIPLKDITVGDYPACKIHTNNSNNITNTTNTYSASFGIGTKKISHEKGIKYPDLDYNCWSINISLNSSENTKLRNLANMRDGLGDLMVGISPLLLKIGESIYNIKSWYLSSYGEHNYLMIDTTKQIIEHISISGFQGLYVNEVNDFKEVAKYSDVSQELWHRCAEEVYQKRKDF